MKGCYESAPLLKQIDNCSENNFVTGLRSPASPFAVIFLTDCYFFLTHSIAHHASPFVHLCSEFRNRRNPKAPKETGDGTKMTRIE